MHKMHKPPAVDLCRVSIQGYYEGHGYYVSVSADKRRVFIGKFSHCSCYGTDEAIQNDLEKNDEWYWEGSAAKLKKIVMSRPRLDLDFPKRRLLKQDYDYEDKALLYAVLKKWFRRGKPSWDDKEFSFDEATRKTIRR